MKSYNPTSNPRRQMTTISYGEHLTRSKPHKALTRGFKRSVGRNNYGRLTTRHKGGGHKKVYRNVDFLFDKKNIPAVVESVEYDPFRTGFIGLVLYKDGERRYVLLPKNVGVGTEFIVSETAPIAPGNRTVLKRVPVGAFVYGVELKPGGGAILARSAGNFAQVIAIEGGYVSLKLPSSEVRKVSENVWASIGEVSNEENHLVNIGKAGRSRWMGIRPTVRGTVQNPVDHPYGGGEGRQGRGTRRAKTRWGRPAGKGQKTRTPKKYSNIFIVSRRKVGKKRDAS